MKQNTIKTKQKGFTVIELLVVFLIMIALAGSGLIAWNSQRPGRNLVLAQNETVTNIRKVQSYAVSSRQTSDGSNAKFYLARFEVDQNSYSVHAIKSDGTYTTEETVNLPSNVTISSINAFATDGGASGGKINCAFVLYSVPFGKVYFSTSDPCDSGVTNLTANLPELATSTNQVLILTLQYTGAALSEDISIYGLTGKVESSS
ncbi:MAG: type II secretion system protein [Candidatus Doudnabacteria bacterium]